jgi:HD-like signal output (HDOD) protein
MLPPTQKQIKLTNNHNCLISITESLNACGQILCLLNLTIRNPSATIAEIATILRKDVVLSARIIKMANSAFFFKNAHPCKTIEDALFRVGLREISRLVTTATMQGIAPKELKAYGISGQEFNKNVIFNATASQLIAKEIKTDPNIAYLSGLMRPLGILILNKWAETHVKQVEEIPWGTATTLLDWETNNFGLNHIEVSSFVTRKWGFPEEISHSIENSTNFLTNVNSSPLTIILKTAEALAENNRATFHSKQTGNSLNTEHLKTLGIKSIQLLEITRIAINESKEKTRNLKN